MWARGRTNCKEWKIKSKRTEMEMGQEEVRDMKPAETEGNARKLRKEGKKNMTKKIETNEPCVEVCRHVHFYTGLISLSIFFVMFFFKSMPSP